MFSDEVFRQRPPWMLLFFLFLTQFSPIKSDELQSLLDFKSAVQNSSTDVFNSWTPNNSVCNFTGIVCNSNEFVTEIDLPQRNLSGSLPFSSICALQWLEKISLGSNSLYGIVTEDLKNCNRLKYLDLGLNSFTGNVPDLSSFRELSFLNLNNSGFSGNFPWKSLENLTNLAFLSLGDNPFDASLFPMEVLKLEKLYWLYLTNCSIGGKIPEGIGNLTLLENLEISDNQLSGRIPLGIGKLKNLRQLEIYNNSLTGKLPAGFGNLTSLINFDASQNYLDGDISELRFLTNLASLQLFENQFTGSIPAEIGEFRNLVGLSLYTNKLTGELPQKLGSWADFNYIDVSENFLTGSIPPDMCKNGQMTDLALLQNNFTGRIPETYADCSSLVRLRVNNNSLSGIVPAGIWSLPNLIIIDLTMNQFEGPLAPEIGKAGSLAQVFVANNRFSGELPPAISDVSSLVSVQLSWNQFSGKIPSTIGKLKKLSRFYLDQNMFSGHIPDSIAACTSLTDVNFAGNSLKGEIPASLGSLPSLNSLNLSKNKLSGDIPASLSSLKLVLLDLSNNKLTGPIPESLSILADNSSFTGNPGLCSSNIEHFPPCSSTSSSSSHLPTIISCFVAGTLVLLISIAGFMILKLRQNNLETPLKKQNSWDLKPYHVLSFSENEIVDAIKQENQIGKGGSGNVYKVVLKNGKELAVKHIWAATASHSNDQRSRRSTSAILPKRSSSSRSPEYDAEVAALSSIRHVNVVKLYCSITSEDSNLLVYEYLPNGSLWDRMHTCRKIEMGWDVRYEIAMGAARGLEYLHHGCDRPVVHRDVKSSNILLDDNWKPRIADFGLAKIVQAGGDWTNVIAGTYGYIAPEYAYTYKVNEKSDVYSFGVVLMELVTGKRPNEPEFGENKDIVYWVYSKMSNETLLDAVDTSIPDSLKEDATKVLRIALHCTAKFPALRPSMRLVVQMLEEAEPCQLTSIAVNKDGEIGRNAGYKHTATLIDNVDKLGERH